MATGIAVSARRRASRDLATHARVEAVTVSRARDSATATAIVLAVVLRAANEAEDVPRVRDEAPVAAAADRNEAARSASPYDRFFGQVRARCWCRQ
jgi:hypothetical protein